MIEIDLNFDIENALIAFSVSLVLLIALKFFIIVIFTIIRPRVEENSIALIFFKQLQKIPLLMLFVISLYAGFMNSGIETTDQAIVAIQTILLIYVFFNIVNLVNKAIKDTTKNLLQNSRNSSQKSVINYISIVLRTVVWVLSIAIILENLGLDVSALVTGLGLSGFAIAFALRSLIKDLIASVVILLERPIKLGDRIVVAKKKGYVHKIGIKSTELMQEDGRIYIIPNSYITEKPVKNYRGDESEDASIEIEIKKHKLKVKVSEVLRGLIKKEYMDLIMEDFEIFLKMIGEESSTYTINFSLKTGVKKDIVTESIMNQIHEALTDQKLKPLNINFILE